MSPNRALEAESESHELQRAFSTSKFRKLRCAIVVAGVLTIGACGPANALPSFARQTGQPCGACHTDFPGLTPFGRQFKLGGYTLGGGDYRTSLFPESSSSTKALASYDKATKAGTPAKKDKDVAAADGRNNSWAPPLAVMAMMTDTHTREPQSGLSPFKSNDNLQLAQFSVFWGGAITNNVGAFAQATYEGPPPGGAVPGDPFSTHQWHWDNVDVRYSGTAKLDGADVTYGVTANNNPTVQDLWNSTPAWSFPYVGSSVAPDPGVGAIVDGALGQTVAGAGGYVYVNNLVYAELSGYRTLDRGTLDKFGTDPFDAPVIDGVAPYWRVAVEPQWGNNWFEVGTFGMMTRVHQWMDPAGYETPTYTQTDRYTDVGFDTQYQYQGDNYWVTLRGTYIHENQMLNGSVANGLADNMSNYLNTARIYGSLAYGDDNRVVVSGQYFDTWGSSDGTLYADLASGMSPDTSGFTVDLAYIPYINSQPPLWPWANARFGVQYTYYDKFQGTTMKARDNNTLLLYAWLAM